MPGKAGREDDPGARKRWTFAYTAWQCLHANSMQGVTVDGTSGISVVVAFLVIFGAHTLCAQSTGSWPRSIVDDMGASMRIPSPPRRIVSLTLPTDEILLSLVPHDRLMAVTGFSADPSVSNVVSQVADIPTKLSQLNAEIVISLRPDLVFVADWTDPSSVRQLRDAGLTVYQFRSPVTVEGIEQGIARVGVAVGEEAAARGLVQWMESKLGAVTDKLAGLPPGSVLTVMDYNTWGTSMGAGSSWDEIVRRAGLRNAVGGLTSDAHGAVPVAEEKILQIDPDILLVPAWVYGNKAGSDSFYRRIVTDPAMKHLRAVQQGRVYRMPENIKSSTSQYIVLAVESLARLAYPERFRQHQ
jgi:iron complex transport system substrate-binding protein